MKFWQRIFLAAVLAAGILIAAPAPAPAAEKVAPAATPAAKGKRARTPRSGAKKTSATQARAPRVILPDVPEKGKTLKDSILPADKKAGYIDEGYILWCPSVIKVGDTYHMFCSRWPASYGLAGWTSQSECAHATSKNLCGPYTFKEVVLKKRADNWDNSRVHNIKIVKAGDTYVIYHINSANQTGFAYSKSIDGPWTRMNQPAMKASNPAIFVKPDNSIYVFARLGVNGKNRGIAFSAPNFMGPYTLLKNGDNLLPGNCDIEDPTIWWANNQYNILINDFTGQATGIGKAGAQFFSKDGLGYTLMHKDPVFTKTVNYTDGSSTTFRRRERPFIYANEKGEALALFTACLIQLPGGGETSIITANPIDHYVPSN